MEFNLHPQEDWLHPLEADQYEALYFAFTARDGRWFGFVRFLLGAEQVLELAALSAEGEQWGMTYAFPRAALRVEGQQIIGPHLRMHLLEGWHRWRLEFEGVLSREEAHLPFTLVASFEAEGEAARYRLGPYQQAEQEGWMDGRLVLGGRSHAARYRAYRDHSWGRRDLGPTPAGWKVATAPGQFYLVWLQMERPIVFGRFESEAGTFPLTRAEVEELAPGLVRYRFPEAGMEVTSRRLAPALDIFLGVGGVEAVRPRPQEGDLLHDKLGPVRYTVRRPQDTVEVLGFLEEARRLV